VTPVYKLSASSVTGRTNYGSMLAGNPVFIDTAFESIATVTVGGGGAADAEFTSIPATYTHLQIRGILRDTYTSTQPALALQINGSNIDRNHNLIGDGASASAYTGTAGYISHSTGGNAGASMFSGIIIDILDYANTNKYRTIRALSGGDRNGSGFIELCSGLEQSTSAVTSITLVPTTTFAEYTHIALYGIKGA
jgi:hypothetical protein